jgi:hypothetical protein
MHFSMGRLLALMLTSVMAAVTGGTALAGLRIGPDTLTPREGAGPLPALLLVTCGIATHLPSCLGAEAKRGVLR